MTQTQDVRPPRSAGEQSRLDDDDKAPNDGNDRNRLRCSGLANRRGKVGEGDARICCRCPVHVYSSLYIADTMSVIDVLVTNYLLVTMV